MRPNMVQLAFDAFLNRYMLDNGQALPSTFPVHRKVPSMSREKLMGLEGEVCKGIVRHPSSKSIDVDSC